VLSESHSYAEEYIAFFVNKCWQNSTTNLHIWGGSRGRNSHPPAGSEI